MTLFKKIYKSLIFILAMIFSIIGGFFLLIGIIPMSIGVILLYYTEDV